MNYTQADYDADINFLANEIVEEIVKSKTDLYDACNETANNCELETYTKYHQYVIWFSPNADRAIDDGTLSVQDNTSSGLIREMVISAIEGDLIDVASGLLDDKIEELVESINVIYSYANYDTSEELQDRVMALEDEIDNLKDLK